MVVARERWRAHPLAWIHRAEARAIARELGAALVEYPDLPGERALLRLSDPVMRRIIGEIQSPYYGPGRDALERCYDKIQAYRIVSHAGFDIPETFLGDSQALPQAPFVVKPRRGSDSIGVRIASDVAPSKRNVDHLVQARIIGHEITIALFRDQVGVPFRILVPPGEIYSFSGKYLFRPGRLPLEDEALRDRARRIGQALGVDWAARVDFIVEEKSKRAYFLECDAAPLVGPDSAWAASFLAGGVDRKRQLEWLVS